MSEPEGTAIGPVTVAIVSDTHGDLAPEIQRVISQCDYAVHAGDILGAGVLELMRPRSGRVFAVRGNNDFPALWHAAEQGILADIPESLQIPLPGGILAVEHGHRHGGHRPDHDSLRRAHPQARAVVYGHTHKLVVDDSGGSMVINPGAAGYTRTHGGPSCLILHARAAQWRVEVRRFPDARHALA